MSDLLPYDQINTENDLKIQISRRKNALAKALAQQAALPQTNRSNKQQELWQTLQDQADEHRQFIAEESLQQPEVKKRQDAAEKKVQDAKDEADKKQKKADDEKAFKEGQAKTRTDIVLENRKRPAQQKSSEQMAIEAALERLDARGGKDVPWYQSLAEHMNLIGSGAGLGRSAEEIRADIVAKRLRKKFPGVKNPFDVEISPGVRLSDADSVRMMTSPDDVETFSSRLGLQQTTPEQGVAQGLDPTTDTRARSADSTTLDPLVKQAQQNRDKNVFAPGTLNDYGRIRIGIRNWASPIIQGGIGVWQGYDALTPDSLESRVGAARPFKDSDRGLFSGPIELKRQEIIKDELKKATTERTKMDVETSTALKKWFGQDTGNYKLSSPKSVKERIIREDSSVLDGVTEDDEVKDALLSAFEAKQEGDDEGAAKALEAVNARIAAVSGGQKLAGPVVLGGVNDDTFGASGMAFAVPGKGGEVRIVFVPKSGDKFGGPVYLNVADPEVLKKTPSALGSSWGEKDYFDNVYKGKEAAEAYYDAQTEEARRAGKDAPKERYAPPTRRP